MVRKVIATLVGALLLAACAPASSNAVPVAVELANDHVTLDPTDVTAGRVVFEVKNQSSDLVHEIEVFAGATAGAVLPVSSSVADTTGLTLVDEIEDIVPGAGASLTVNLEAGTYLVMCNLPEHYGNGMWAFLTVADS